MLGTEFTIIEIDVELFAEPLYGHGGEAPAVGVDVGQVVARMFELTATGQDQPAAISRPGSRVAVKLPCGTGKPTLT